MVAARASVSLPPVEHRQQIELEARCERDLNLKTRFLIVGSAFFFALINHDLIATNPRYRSVAESKSIQRVRF